MQVDLLPIVLIFLGFIAIIFFINKRLSDLKNKSTDQSMLEWLKTMQHSLEHTNKTLNDAMRTSSNDTQKILLENSKQLNERLDKAAVVIREVGREVGQMSEIGRSMKELQDFLKSPKLRGNIGEQVLKDLISQMFPKNSFHLQYAFKSGEKVDAAIKMDAGILPIDSKFPMENFQKMAKAESENEKMNVQKEFIRDIKKHIDDIAKKYIIPDEGTMDFALMYLPSESVYYELVNLPDIMEYARRSRVYPVSPSTFYAHLQTILLSFEGKRMESRSKEILRLLRTLQIDYEKVNENLGLLGKHLNNASTQFTNVATGFTHLGNKLQTAGSIEEKSSEEIDNNTGILPS